MPVSTVHDSVQGHGAKLTGAVAQGAAHVLGDAPALVALADDARFGRVDLPVKNGGIFSQSPVAKLRVGEPDRMIYLNIKGGLHGIAALPGMRAQNSGHIDKLSSVAGLKVSVGVGTVYSATKFAVKAMSEGLRAEVAGDNIRVTARYPGAIDRALKLDSSEPNASADSVGPAIPPPPHEA
ncbi:MAG: SDR family NAD(P)-dependent oxidoreductase [Paracoccus sp. (in: a-proteobacteria)]|nr:SDR family NAD(P)-dependent oxidoreductase [Paracoccus sp. (in: a-proteobacteria)]